MSNAERFDVVIYEIKTRLIDAIAGEALRFGGYGKPNTVETRLATVMPRLNDRYRATHVPAGSVKVGDKLPVGK